MMVIYVFELEYRSGMKVYKALKTPTLEIAETMLERMYASEPAAYELFSVLTIEDYRKRAEQALVYQAELMTDLDTSDAEVLSSKMNKLRGAGYGIVADYDQDIIVVYPTLDITFRGGSI